jgi:hypothetical protein
MRQLAVHKLYRLRIARCLGTITEAEFQAQYRQVAEQYGGVL